MEQPNFINALFVRKNYFKAQNDQFIQAQSQSVKFLTKVHKGKKPFQCNICNAGFLNKEMKEKSGNVS